MEGLGGIADNSEVNIDWNGSLESRKNFELNIKKQDPNVKKLVDNSTTFDLFNPTTGDATSAKTLNTLNFTYINDPRKIYKKVAGYVDAAVNYERIKESDIDASLIESKTLQLAIPEWTSSTQWQHLYRAVVYGKDNGVSVVITRIRE